MEPAPIIVEVLQILQMEKPVVMAKRTFSQTKYKKWEENRFEPSKVTTTRTR